MKEKFKPINKKDLPKLIGLVVLAVGAFVFALIQLAPITSASSPPAKAKTAAGESGSGVTASSAASAATPGKKNSESASDETTFVAGDIAILTSGKDPFVPNGPAALEDASKAAKPPVVPTTPAVPVEQKPTTVAIATSRETTEQKLQAPERTAHDESEKTTPAEPKMPPAPVPPAYIVTGVVRGQNPDGSDNVAILRGAGGSSSPAVAAATAAPLVAGAPPALTAAAETAATGEAGSDRRFVRVGDMVGNGFVVVAVRRDGVTIACGERSRVTLMLGENSRAK
jgi:hypothetical protein